MNIIARWDGPYLWDGANNKRGLVVFEDLKTFSAVDINIGYVGSGDVEYFVKLDLAWKLAFDTILGGLPPSWCECSCGAKTVMGIEWDDHTPLCDGVTLQSPFFPKNNDGRLSCVKCDQKTIAAGGGAYLICNNVNCDWYKK